MGLANQRKSHLMQTQINEIIVFVRDEQEKGRTLSEVLRAIKVSRTSYYRWIKNKSVKESAEKRVTVKTLTQSEMEMITLTKSQNPQMRHRQIQGLIQNQGLYLSPTSVYKCLKSHDLVEPYARREAAWKEARYELISANMMWGADWTKLRIGGVRWYLLTCIDFFSRKLIHHEIVPTVNSGHIKALYKDALGNENIPLDWHLKPELRVDRGSPNTSKVTQEFFKDLQADLSFARVARPTDNARTERFYRTIKQEEIYIVGDYQDEKTAIEVIGKYVNWYNAERPHQALWNFTPEQVQEINNKTEILKMLKALKIKTWTTRKEYWKKK